MKKTFYTIIYVFLVTFGSFLSVQAIPAPRGPIEVTQPDGSKLTILLRGDEFFHYARSTDGYLLKENTDGYYTYAKTNARGTLVSTEVVANNVGRRAKEEVAFLQKMKTDLTSSELFVNTVLQKRMSRVVGNNSSLRSSNTLPPGLLATYPTTGTPKSLVILVNFTDVAFKATNTTTSFSNMLNKVGYDSTGHVGSVRDFYKFNSGGLFAPDYVVVGPVTVSKPMAYYGGNDTIGNDLRPAEMVYEACQKAGQTVNFANFDYDNDGNVDNVYIFYAGKGEADGGSANTIWPHSWSLSGAKLNLTLNGKKIDAYACSGELNGTTGKMTGMGTFTHEYGHILGLTDMYDVDYDKYNGDSFDLNYWSLMAYGAYNNNSSTPPCLTFAERYFLGWATPVELNTSQDVTLNDLGSSNQGYIIKTKNDGEFYLLENRQPTKNIWDRYLPDSTFHGMLVYHLDLRSDQNITLNYWGTTFTMPINELWTYNMVNAISSHQCCDIEEADNEPLLYNGKNFAEFFTSIGGDPFPGSTGANQFTDNTKPSMTTWDGSNLVKPITSVTEKDGVIRFKFMDFSEFNKRPKVLSASDIGPYSFAAVWNSVVNATGYLVSVFTEDLTKNPVEKTYLNGYQNKLVVDTFVNVSVSKDLTKYYYQVQATNNNTLYTPISDSIFLTTTDGTPVVKPATSVDDFTFRANWLSSSYATGYYLDVFTIDSSRGDTIWVEGFKNQPVSKNSQILTELDDQTQYQYRVRGTNGKVISRSSSVAMITTSKATEILAYVKDHVLYLKGMDKGGKVVLYGPDGKVAYFSNVNHIAVDRPGIYLISARFDGKEKHLKFLIN